ncbi:hypothetical protein H5410_001719 [Solanum commersonii]|uniref:CSD domain-containing protein n=1 Tax=Solanum commersonii TaxID=4109 RepID=A0A9J6B0D2_SOLCO|nr:hypothetical protein H5410_001719 [Solanum commersonii]
MDGYFISSTKGYRNTGTVKWFSDQKGFSFISPDDDDLVTKMVSVSLLIRSEGFRTLVDDGAVEFDVEPANAGCTKVINDTGQMVLLSKKDPMMIEVVEVINMVVVVDIDVEVGDMVVMKVVTTVAGGWR